MNDTPKKTEKKNPDRPRRRLLRSRDDRMIWGVAGGVAEQIGVGSTLVRIGFVVAALFSGFGLLAYLVLAVALPEDDGTGNPRDEQWTARLGRVVLVSILALAALCAACALAVGAAWATATGHGIIVAAVVIALGAAVLAAAFAPGVNRRLIPWVLGGALALAIPAGAVAAADIEIDESIGQREYRPTTIGDLHEDGYALGTGQLIVDLRGLPWEPGEEIPVEADLGFGQMIVSVPTDVCVDAHASAKGGELLVAGDRSDGVNAEVDQGEPATDAPTLKLDAELQFGQLVVTDDDPDEVDDRHYDRDRNDEEADSQLRVCGR
jgi:phage shock protein PspC (stress-responsive transcriptional regulator)